MLIPLDFPFSYFQIFLLHQTRGSSPSPQVSSPAEPGALSTDLLSQNHGLLWAGRDLEHPVPPQVHHHLPLSQNPQFIPLSIFPLDRKSEFLSARLCSLPTQFSSTNHFFPGGCWDSWKPLLETTGTSSHFPSLRHAKLDKAERTWEHFCLREETQESAEEHPESSCIIQRTLLILLWHFIHNTLQIFQVLL